MHNRLPALLALAPLMALVACTETEPGANEDASVVPDLEREARLAETVRELIWDAEVIDLLPLSAAERQAQNDVDSTAVSADPDMADEDNRSFIAVHTRAIDNGADHIVLLLHGRGHHPLRTHPNDSLRLSLAEFGIASLAIQLPVLAIGSSYNQYLPLLPRARQRIDASLDWLEQYYPEAKIHIAAHSCGVHMMMDWIDHNGDERIDSFIGLAMHNFIPDQSAPMPYPIEQMNTPIFDVMGERSARAVLRRAWLRQAKARAGRTPYRQLILSGTGSTFEGQEDALTAAVVEFIDR